MQVYSWDDFEREIRTMYRQPSNAKATLRKHLHAIAQLRKVADQPCKIDIAAIGKLLDDIDSRQLRPASVNSILRTVRRQTRFLCKRHVLDINPFDLHDFGRREGKSEKRSLSVVELGSVLDVADDEIHRLPTPRDNEYFMRIEKARVWRARRLRALVYLLSHTGLRAMEALTLEKQSIDLVAGTVRICSHDRFRPKTVKSERVIPVPAAALDAIRDWMPEATGRFLFRQVTNPNLPWTSGDMRYRPLTEVRKLGHRANVEDLNLLTLRHTFCSLAKQLWGLTQEQVRLIMGHTTVDTQEGYTHAQVEVLKDLMKGKTFRKGA